jgi:hypothetical protein
MTEVITQGRQFDIRRRVYIGILPGRGPMVAHSRQHISAISLRKTALENIRMIVDEKRVRCAFANDGRKL